MKRLLVIATAFLFSVPAFAQCQAGPAATVYEKRVEYRYESAAIAPRYLSAQPAPIPTVVYVPQAAPAAAVLVAPAPVYELRTGPFGRTRVIRVR